MGGENTEVSDSTTSVVLETANFEPLTVLRSGERHRMRSESQTRWEKGVDFELAPVAATLRHRAARRARGCPLDGRERGARPIRRRRRGSRIRPAYASEALGLDVRRGRAARAARPARVRGRAPTGRCVSPSWRARDVRRDIDVVEEVARFRLEEVPATLPVRQAMFGRLNALPAAAPPGRGRARRRRALRGVHLLAAGRAIPIRTRSSCRCRSARSSGCCARR